ncbi:ABC transporter permease [Nocardioides stalactiti]|uniref:ABC transporter permease n=1 Tax=Nocardioides stalactiti TaxID=2755356 RepID=UPI001600A16B|nr:ABC transporter permease [Nocardioides stalactiti]
MRLRYVCQDALVSSVSRPSKLFLTAFGAMLGVASLVAISGLTTTAGTQIIARFDSASSTYVSIENAGEPVNHGDPRLRWASGDGVARIEGVVRVALSARLAGITSVVAVPLDDPTVPEATPPAVLAATADLGEVLGLRLSDGRMFDRGHEERGDNVVVVGAQAAGQLGVDDLALQRVVFINDVAYDVVGIFDEAIDNSFLGAVIMPARTAQTHLGATSPDVLHVIVRPGSARLVAEQGPIALAPSGPTAFAASYTPDPTDLREQVGEDTRAMFVVVGFVSMLAGTVGIMNTMLLNVMERTGEIGLRRALGAKRAEIVVQFLTESAVVGVVSGAAGSAIGMVVIVALAESRSWAPVAEWWLMPVGFALGVASGLVAGAFPAWRAARIEPASSLRAA